MKYGYANLLSEAIDAALLTHEDCRAFQIVCPICREPVFKVERARPESLHYLSHYAAAAAYSAECELRVGKFDPREVEAQNALSRGQKIALFLKVFREAVLRYEMRCPREKSDTLLRLLERSKPLEFLRGQMLQWGERFGSEDWIFLEGAEHYVKEDVGIEHPMWKTGLAIQTQQRIALDMWRTLWTPPARENACFLWNFGYAMVMSRLQISLDRGLLDAPSRLLRRYVEKLVQSSRRGGMQLLAEMGATPAPQPFAEPGSNYFIKLQAEVTHEMIGCLLRLPYLEILRENQQQSERS